MNDSVGPGPLNQIVPQLGAVIAVIMFIVASISGAGGSTSALEGFGHDTAGRASTNPESTTTSPAPVPETAAPAATAAPTAAPTTAPSAPAVTVRGSTAVTNSDEIVSILSRGLVSVDNPAVTVALDDEPDQQTVVISSSCSVSRSVLSGFSYSGEVIVTDTTVRRPAGITARCADGMSGLRVNVPAPFVIFSRADGSYVLADGPGVDATGPRFRPAPAAQPVR